MLAFFIACVSASPENSFGQSLASRLATLNQPDYRLTDSKPKSSRPLHFSYKTSTTALR
jgi:hypothetical protein